MTARPDQRGRTRLRDLARLVRAPAALTVPGDVLVGATRTGPLRPRLLVTMASSVCLYWAGMALNDYADRDLDALERPERPIPSGVVTPGTAVAVASGLTAAGLGLAIAANGRRGLASSLPLAGGVWLYDLALKPTAAGPAAMAALRGLIVLAGGGQDAVRRGLPAAATVGVHTLVVTWLSRHEVGGAAPVLPAVALTATCAITAATLCGPNPPGPLSRTLARLLGLAYVATCGRAQLAAAADPSAQNVRRAVAAGIHGLMPLQGMLAASAGSPVTAVTVAAAFPVARWLGGKVSPT